LEYGRDEGRLLEQVGELRGLLSRDASERGGAETG
jgi:hypothetical protein